ncbi:DUF6973 domain-containing protein [Plantactinospora sp. GCM10030261]|uniref:DUF6973 domain-containing protein n=1 Tax=Plantactinospora sp. GCM10030261 TaxID=3273420 RepID=UPI003618B34B
MHDEAFKVADSQYASPDRHDDQDDAFRHAYWNAALPRSKLARRVREAVDGGRTVVIDGEGDLAYSDQVPAEETGKPEDTTLPGHPQPEKAAS